jgi:hypothetical protein
MYLKYAITMGTHIRRGHKHGRRKRKMAGEQGMNYVLKQMCFSVNDNAIILEYCNVYSR